MTELEAFDLAVAAHTLRDDLRRGQCDHCQHSNPATLVLAEVVQALINQGDTPGIRWVIDEFARQHALFGPTDHSAWRAREREALARDALHRSIQCPYCGAAPDEVCVTAHGNDTANHVDRRRAYQHLTEGPKEQ